MANLVFVGVGAGDVPDPHFGVTLAEAQALVHAAFLRAFGELGAHVYASKPPLAGEPVVRTGLVQPGERRTIVASGTMGSGKSTFMAAVRTALEANERRVQELALARALKDLARYYFDLSERQVDGTIEEKSVVDERWGLSSRRILQLLGTEGMRAVAGDGIWRRAWQARLDLTADVVLVPDGRFFDELEDLRLTWGAELYYIDRTEATEAMLKACNGNPHSSEVDMANYAQYTERIDNNGPLAALLAAAARIAA